MHTGDAPPNMFLRRPFLVPMVKIRHTVRARVVDTEKMQGMDKTMGVSRVADMVTLL